MKCFYVAIGQKESTVAGVDRGAARARRDGLHDRHRRRRQRPGPAAVHRPLRRHGDGRVLHVQGRARPDRLRRLVEAGRRLSPAVAADAASAGPRGVSRRRVLLPQPAAGAVGQAERRARRRLADVAADHRDAGRRSVGLHSDQRDLDHRRPDLPAARLVLRRRPAGHERRHLGVPRRRQRPDQGHEEGRRRSAARPGRVPRAGSVRPARHRARRGHAVAARPRLPHGRDAQAGAVPADGRDRPGADHLTPAPAATSTTFRATEVAAVGEGSS